MPDYKKVKRRRKKLFKQKNDIFMKPNDNHFSAEGEATSSFRVISGRKEKIRNRNIVVSSIAFVLIALIFLFSFLSPTGLVESLNHYFSGISIRAYYPINLEGNELFSVTSRGRHFFALNNMTLSSYNTNGKELFEHYHGCENPVVTLSETRALLYEQNGNTVSVFNAEKQLLNFQTEFAIYSADIARNGYFAVATKAQSYTSSVIVYDDNGISIYEWYSPEEIVTSVALSPNGKQLAVSTVKSLNGIFVSNVYILTYDSVEPTWKQTYNDTFISSLISDYKNYFCVVSQNKCDFVRWKEHSITSYTTENDIQMLRNDSKNTVICEPRSSDTSQNKFTVYNKKNEVAFQYEFFGYVDDFAIKSGNLYILSGNKVFLINDEGETVKSAECAFGTIKILPVSNNSFIAVSDNTLAEIHF